MPPPLPIRHAGSVPVGFLASAGLRVKASVAAAGRVGHGLRVRTLALALVFACAISLVLAPPALRADPAIEGPAQRLFQRIMSPYCPGLQLAACPSPQADALRNEIRASLIAGRTSDEIEADLHRRFGGGTRAEPAFAGLGRIVWIVPIVLFLAGGAALAVWLRRCRQPIAASSANQPAGAPEAPRETDTARAAALRQRLDDELDAM